MDIYHKPYWPYWSHWTKPTLLSRGQHLVVSGFTTISPDRVSRACFFSWLFPLGGSFSRDRPITLVAHQFRIGGRRFVGWSTNNSPALHEAALAASPIWASAHLNAAAWRGFQLNQGSTESKIFRCRDGGTKNSSHPLNNHEKWGLIYGIIWGILANLILNLPSGPQKNWKQRPTDSRDWSISYWKGGMYGKIYVISHTGLTFG